ncbi:MAG: hypothetical protein AB9869_15870 [Verrucomicrobiia bacterium]
MTWILLKNSLLVAAGTAAFTTAAGATVALGLMGAPVAVRRLVLVASAAALALPPFLVTNCWLDLLGVSGVWRRALPVDIYSLGGTIWVLTLLFWPVPLFFVLGSLRKLDPRALDCEPALRGWPMVRRLLIPMARPGLALGATLSFVLAFNNFAVPAILQTKVFPAELWVSFNTTFDYANALALSWPMVLVPLLLFTMLRAVRTPWPRTARQLSGKVFRERFGRIPIVLAAAFTGGILALSLGVPLVQLLLPDRTWRELPVAFAAGHQAVLNSVLFASAVASVCGVAGVIFWRWRAAASLWIPFLAPGVLVGIVLIFALNREPLVALYQSGAVVVLALALRFGALSWAGTRHAMQAVDTRLLDFARLNGAGASTLFRRVSWPQVAPELAATWIVTYVLCLWDVETLVLIIPPGCETLALRIFNLLHYGHNDQVNALCVLLLALAVLPVAVWALFAGMRRKPAIVLSLVIAAAGAGCRGSPDSAPIKSQLFTRVEVLGTRGTGVGQFNKPRSLTLDATDALYVVDMTGRVQKFSPQGAFVLSWQMPQTDLGKPKGMCRDAKGNIVVVEPHYHRAGHFSPEGKLLVRWGTPGTNDGQLCLPRAVAANRGEMLVCEYSQVDRVQAFSADGSQWLRTFGRTGRGPGEFNRPEGLSTDSQGRIYVADSCNHRIQIFTPEGKFLRSYGRPGSGVGELSYPYDVQVDGAGLQFVAEFGNSRVQVFDHNGGSIEVLGGPGSAPGQFSNPWSLALDSAGNLYVADSQNHRVQKFVRARP